jgi:predicted DNA-binding transcriptional regulator YafY
LVIAISCVLIALKPSHNYATEYVAGLTGVQMGRPKKNYSQAERLLRIYDMLWRGASIRAVELAEIFGLSRRSCERDLAVLKSVLGLRLVEESKLEHKVFKIPRDLKGTDVSHAQVLAFLCGAKVIDFLSGPSFRLDAAGLGELLRASLPKHSERLTSARLPNKLHVTSVGNKMYSGQEDKQETLSQMTQALLYEKPIQVSYMSASRAAPEPFTHLIHPLAMVIHRGGVYYVVDIVSEDSSHHRRLMALDRIEVTFYDPTGPMFLYPEEFDVENYFADSFGIFTGKTSELVQLRFAAHYAQYVEERTWHHEQHMERDADGRLILTFPVSSHIEISDWILGMGNNVEVLAPTKLREFVVDRLRTALANYSDC